MKIKTILTIATLTLVISFIAIKVHKAIKYGVKYDNIYVINLDRSPERLQKMKAQFDKQHIPFERLSAVDGNELDIISKDKHDKITHIKGSDFKNTPLGDYWKSKYSVNCSENIHMTNIKLSPGEIGVFCSQMKIYEDIVKNHYSAAVIFEDDVILGDNFKEKLNEALANTPKNFQILYLGVEIYDPPKKVTKNLWFNNKVKMIKSKTHTSGAYAYVISYKYAKSLLLNLQGMNKPIDDILYDINKRQYFTTDRFVDVIIEDSEIEKMGRDH